jgi:hypothetical protein
LIVGLVCHFLRRPESAQCTDKCSFPLVP